jgi:hypothetical protein
MNGFAPVIPVPTSRVRRIFGRVTPSWRAAVAGAAIAGIAFCLLTCQNRGLRQILGSVGWGSLPALWLLFCSFFRRRRSASPLVASPPGRFVLSVRMGLAVLGGAGVALALIFLYFVLEFICFLTTFDGFGPPGGG